MIDVYFERYQNVVICERKYFAGGMLVMFKCKIDGKLQARVAFFNGALEIVWDQPTI